MMACPPKLLKGGAGAVPAWLHLAGAQGGVLAWHHHQALQQTRGACRGSWLPCQVSVAACFVAGSTSLSVCECVWHQPLQQALPAHGMSPV